MQIQFYVHIWVFMFSADNKNNVSLDYLRKKIKCCFIIPAVVVFSFYAVGKVNFPS